MKKYLQATSVIDFDHPSVSEKARYLTKERKDIIGKARSIFYFVRDEIKYNIYVSKSLPEHFRASNTLSKREGYCVQKAILLVALARAVGIPSGLGFARIRNNILPEKTQKWLGTNIFPFHGFGELYIDGKWVKATPAFDLKMCERNRIVPVEFDGKNDAVLHSHSRDGELHIEYLKYIGRYDDLPLDQLRDVVIKHFGSRFDEPPRRNNKGQ